MKDFSLSIKHCYCIACSVEKVQRLKIQTFQGQKMEE